MKIRIPLVLRAAVLSAIALSVSSQATAEEIVLSLGTTTKKITGDLTVSGDERVGYIKDDDSLYTDFVLTDANKRTENLQVTGTLIVEGQVAVGGGNSDGGNVAKLTAGTVEVRDNGYLKATGADIKNMIVKSGTVELFTGTGQACASGSNDYTADSRKIARISNSVQISGGKLLMGPSGAYIVASRNHYKTGFKGTINQTGGIMAVRGDSCTGDEVTINQTGNKTCAMYFTDMLGINRNSSKLTINQNNDNATLVIGRFNDPAIKAGGTKKAKNVIINQTNNGLIQLAHGSEFSTQSIITISQSGGGRIEIGGGLTKETQTATGRSAWGADPQRDTGFKSVNTEYSITQNGKGASITLKGTKGKAANITVSSLNQSAGNTITVESGAGLTISAATATIGGTLANSGTVTANSLSIAGTFQNMATLTATSVSFADGGEIVNTGTMTIDNLNLDNGTLKGAGTYEVNSNITIDSGTFEFTLADAVVTTSLSDTSNFGGTMLDMNGNDLTIGSGAEIALGMSGDVQAMFESMLADDDMAPVNFTMQVARGIGNIEDIDLTALKEQTAHTAYLSNISYSKDGSGNLFVTGTLAPEPTTATLSLMALAALAARRRRR